MTRSPIALIILIILCLGFIWLWEAWFAYNNGLVVFFGRPRQIFIYLFDRRSYLLWASLYCVATSVISLILAGAAATVLLAIGLFNKGGMRWVERLAVQSQTIPFLAIVIVCFLLEGMLFKALHVNLPTWIYSIGPVTVSSFFPALRSGAESINRMPIEIKALLRLWQSPAYWGISRVYLPYAFPDILAGLRISAAWAVGATLISDGLFVGVELDARTLGHLLSRPFSAPAGQTPSVIIISTFLAYIVYRLFVGVHDCAKRWLLGTAAQSEEAYSLQHG